MTEQAQAEFSTPPSPGKLKPADIKRVKQRLPNRQTYRSPLQCPCYH